MGKLFESVVYILFYAELRNFGTRLPCWPFTSVIIKESEFTIRWATFKLKIGAGANLSGGWSSQQTIASSIQMIPVIIQFFFFAHLKSFAYRRLIKMGSTSSPFMRNIIIHATRIGIGLSNDFVRFSINMNGHFKVLFFVNIQIVKYFSSSLWVVKSLQHLQCLR
jgi:hypothetical protein